jgi:hypothetical protein
LAREKCKSFFFPVPCLPAQADIRFFKGIKTLTTRPMISETQEEKIPKVLQYQGAIDAQGFQTYYAYIEDACSTFFTARPPPRRLKVYFTPKRGQGTRGYISPKFY